MSRCQPECIYRHPEKHSIQFHVVNIVHEKEQKKLTEGLQAVPVKFCD